MPATNVYFIERAAGGGGGGGGGRGGGGSSGGGRSSGGGGSSGGRSSGGGGGSSVPRTGQPGSGSSSSSNRGGGTPRTITGNVPFAGRSFGGAERFGTTTNIYGSRAYGSGYTTSARGYNNVASSGFPFGYWPLFLGAGAGYSYYGSDIYGPRDNSSRPGGPQQLAVFFPPGLSLPSSPPANTLPSATVSSDGTGLFVPQYGVYGDQTSVQSVVNALKSNCSSSDANLRTISDNAGFNGTLTDQPGTGFLNATLALQYYRASSFLLFSYIANDTSGVGINLPPGSTASPQIPGVTQAPVYLYDPSTTNAAFLDCVNATIANVLPIENGFTGSAAITRPNASVGSWLVTGVMALFLGKQATGAKLDSIMMLLAVVLTVIVACEM